MGRGIGRGTDALGEASARRMGLFKKEGGSDNPDLQSLFLLKTWAAVGLPGGAEVLLLLFLLLLL